jgi:hypothetical protein
MPPINSTICEPSNRELSTIKPRSGLYREGDQTLFVPTEDMCLVHEASKHTAIEQRAGLPEETFSQWRLKYKTRWPEIEDWLYGAKAPGHPWRRVDSSRRFPKGAISWFGGEPIPDAYKGIFQPSPEMIAFRQEASISGVTRAAIRKIDQIGGEVRLERRKDHVSHRLLNVWRDECNARLPWFDAWLLRGVDAPENVTVATVNQIRRFRAACDYIGICKEIGISPENTYMTEWHKNGLLPREMAWLLWLFGFQPPSNVFVMSLELQNLRSEMTTYRIALAAKLDPGTVAAWKKNESLSGVLKEACEIAERTGRPGPLALWSTKKTDFPRETIACMVRYATHSTLRSCCNRAGILPVAYYKCVRVSNENKKYLHLEDEFGVRGQFRKTGLLAPNLFVPSEHMLNFRNEANRLMREHRVPLLLKVPGAYEWFVDWVTPTKIRQVNSISQSNPLLSQEQEIDAISEVVKQAIRKTLTSGKRPPTNGDAEATGQEPHQPRAENQTRKTAGRNREREKHLEWKRWRDENDKSVAQIAKKADVTEDAVKKAFRKLREEDALPQQ